LIGHAGDLENRETGMSHGPREALLLIDLQNDYFPGGAFPLWNTDQTLANLLAAIERAKARSIDIVHIQHIADPKLGLSPFFNKGTAGAAIRAEVFAAAPDAPVVLKAYADSFVETTLEQTLAARGVTDLLVAGMMTQNCVTHTAISKAAEKYNATILTDCTTTVSEILHQIALHAVSTRVPLTTSSAAMS
jgi:nicotinamidase-related amidase